MRLYASAPCVIERETLRFLDYLTWLGSTKLVAERCACDVSTVSRNLAKCSKTLHLQRQKKRGEWHVTGNGDLLREERKVHQYERWHHSARIRVDGHFHHQPLFLENPPQSFEIGCFAMLDATAIHMLVADAVVDLFFVNAINVPDLGPELSCIRLSSEPMELYVFPGHPLLELTAEQRSLQAARHYPAVAYGKTIMPAYEKAYAQLFRTRIPAFDASRFDIERIAANLNDHPNPVLPTTASLGWAGKRLGHPPVQPLGIDLPIPYGDAVLLRSEYVDHPIVIDLLGTLRRRLQELQLELPRLRSHLTDENREAS